jgi:hypothetical protein
MVRRFIRRHRNISSLMQFLRLLISPYPISDLSLSLSLSLSLAGANGVSAFVLPLFAPFLIDAEGQLLSHLLILTHMIDM